MTDKVITEIGKNFGFIRYKILFLIDGNTTIKDQKGSGD